MSLQKLIISVLCLLATICYTQGDPTTLTTPFLIKQQGYPFEEHKVQTSDGYILTMHRIPYSPNLNQTNATQRPVAFLMHGLLCSSSVFTLNGRNSSLAFILADAGYDVWMANNRGNLYSKEHILLSPDAKAFWNFGFEEISIYDMPAMIDYALNVTGEQQVRYIGHSQGGTTFFVLNALQPDYVKRRIRSAHVMAPMVFISHTTQIPATSAATLLGLPNPTLEITGSTELLASSRNLQSIAERMCKDGQVTQGICSSVLFLMVGGASPYLNTTQLPQILSILPAGASINPLIHFTQLYKSGKFRRFDYGSLRNFKEYFKVSPPDYNLSNLEVPTYVYYSDNDILAHPTDINTLVDILNQTRAFKGAYRVPLTEWNHIDFVFGLNVENVVYNVLLNHFAES